MRTGAQQQSPTANPDMRVTVDSDVYASIDIGEETARLLSAHEDEQVWGGVYHFYIDNSDEALNNKDYKGEAVVVNHGFVGEAGSNIGDLWVDDQEFISREGVLVLHLICIDAWGLLSRVKGTVGGAYWNFPWQDPDKLAELALPVSGEPLPATLITAIGAHWNKTVQNIVTTTISNALGMTVFLDDNDGLTTTQKPQVSSLDARSVVVQAMQVTKSYLLWKADGRFHIVEPGSHATAYSYSVADLFFNNTEEQALVIPNRVLYWFINKVDPNDSSTWVWTSGSAVDSESYNRLGIYIDEHHNLEQEFWEGIASQSEANARATARLYHIQLGKATGTLVAPMHCAQELFDKITIIDDRYSPSKTITGYVFRIIREYDRGVYKISLRLGGVETGYTPGGGEDIRKAPKATPSPIIPSPMWQIPEAIQGYYHNIIFTAVDYNTVSWTSGTIEFYDGTTRSISSGSKNLTSATLRYVYFDLDAGSPNVLKTTTNYLGVMSLRTGVVCLIKRGSDSSVNAMVIPSYGKEPLITADVIYLTGLLDKLPNGTYGKVLATSITAGRILIDELYTSGETYGLVRQTDISAGHILLSTCSGDLDDIANGTYGKVLTADISAGHIILSSVVQSSSYRTVTDGQKSTWDGKPDDMDEIGEGSTYKRVLATNISAGRIQLTAANYYSTKFTGEWYSMGAESGVDIDASSGINIYGKNNALTTRQTKTGTIQCYVGSDGKLYAGAGAVILDAGGLHIKGQWANFYDSNGVFRGLMYGRTDGQLEITPADLDNYIAVHKVRPFADSTSGFIFRTTAAADEGSIKIKGGGSGDIYIYTDGAWRTNT